MRDFELRWFRCNFEQVDKLNVTVVWLCSLLWFLKQPCYCIASPQFLKLKMNTVSTGTCVLFWSKYASRQEKRKEIQVGAKFIFYQINAY